MDRDDDNVLSFKDFFNSLLPYFVYNDSKKVRAKSSSHASKSKKIVSVNIADKSVIDYVN